MPRTTHPDCFHTTQNVPVLRLVNCFVRYTTPRPPPCTCTPAPAGKSAYGTLVAPGVVAHHHQHFFCVRMDMAVDDPEGGRALSVSG